MSILRSFPCSDATRELLRFRIGDHFLGSTYQCARPPTFTTHTVLVSMSSARILRCMLLAPLLWSLLATALPPSLLPATLAGQ